MPRPRTAMRKMRISRLGFKESLQHPSPICEVQRCLVV